VEGGVKWGEGVCLTPGSILQPLLELHDLVLDSLGEGGAELLEVLLGELSLLEPLGGIDRQELLHGRLVNGEAAEIDGVSLGKVADGGLDGDVLVLNPLRDPLKHTRVVTESRPQELPITIIAKKG